MGMYQEQVTEVRRFEAWWRSDCKTFGFRATKMDDGSLCLGGYPYMVTYERQSNPDRITRKAYLNGSLASSLCCFL